MKRSLLIAACVAVGCFAAVATSAVLIDGSDELGDDTGVFLSPADTPNGEQYAELDDSGELFVSLDTVHGTTTTIDDVFVMGYTEGGERTDPVEVSMEYDDDVITINRMDTGEPVDGTGDTVVLSPGDTVTFGFVAQADDPGTVVEEVTYSLNVSDDGPDDDPDNGTDDDPDDGTDDDPDDGTDDDPDDGTDDDPDDGTDDDPDDGTDDDPGPGPGDEVPFYNVTIDNVTTPVMAGDDVVVNATVENTGDAADVQTIVLRDFAGEVVDTTELALDPGENASLQFVWSTGADDVGTDEVTVASRNDTDYANADSATVTVETTDTALVPFDFGGFVFAWYVWLLIAAMLTVLTDYLVQTRVRGVLPLLQTPEETRRTRFRYATARLAALWLVALVFALGVLGLLWLAGLTGWPLFFGVLLASIALGGVLGYYLLPDIEGDYVDVDESGTSGGGSPPSGSGPHPSPSGEQSPEDAAVSGESTASGAGPAQSASDESTPRSDGGESTSADSTPPSEGATTSTGEDARTE